MIGSSCLYIDHTLGCLTTTLIDHVLATVNLLFIAGSSVPLQRGKCCAVPLNSAP